MRSGSALEMALLNDRNGDSPLYVCSFRPNLIFPSGWPGGQTTSTVHPALANAIASRAVGYQRNVVATKTLGFTVV